MQERYKGPNVNTHLLQANGPPPPSRVGKRARKTEFDQNSSKSGTLIKPNQMGISDQV